MSRLRSSVLAVTLSLGVAFAPIAPALAGGHGYGHGHGHGWGHGEFGLVGAVVALATLPLVVAGAVLSAAVPENRGYDGPPAYAPAPAYYPPSAYYAPAPYYDRGYERGYDRGYGHERRAYAPRGAYAPNTRYYGGHGAYANPRSGGDDYRRR
jgi:hypothetical protein